MLTIDKSWRAALAAQLNRLDVSLRRYYVDDFHFRHVSSLRPGSRVLDLGGVRLRKRGAFDIERYDLHVVYANLSANKKPDVRSDAALLPFARESFDAVICSELLEHVPDPAAVLHEICRVLRPAGILLICAPFLTPIHGDPEDYGRYTDRFWERALRDAGFAHLQIERQGLFWSVVADMMRHYVLELHRMGRPRVAVLRSILLRFALWAKRRAVRKDASPSVLNNSFLSSFTTGFGIKAIRPARQDEADEG